MPRGESPFCSGNRARLYAFSQSIAEQAADARNILCLIDRDCESVIQTVELIPQVILTDYASLYVTFAEFAFLHDLVSKAFKAALSRQTWETIREACLFLFAFRVMRYSRFPEAQPLHPDRAFETRGRAVEVDRLGFATKFISKNGLQIAPADLLRLVEEIEVKLTDDPRLFIHFHDFVAVLTTVLRGEGTLKAAFREEHVEAMFYAAAQPAALAGCNSSDNSSIGLHASFRRRHERATSEGMNRDSVAAQMIYLQIAEASKRSQQRNPRLHGYDVSVMQRLRDQFRGETGRRGSSRTGGKRRGRRVGFVTLLHTPAKTLAKIDVGD